MDQHSRMAVLQEYKAGKHHVLVATDVAARGLDIKSIKSVVNYDAAREVDTHVHRIGRTGRAGDKEGIAYTLITPYETRFAGELCIAQRHLSIPCMLRPATRAASTVSVHGACLSNNASSRHHSCHTCIDIRNEAALCCLISTLS